ATRAPSRCLATTLSRTFPVHDRFTPLEFRGTSWSAHMKKNFVLDTNVLLHDPRAIFHFADNQVVIPIYVLEEIDHFKKELSERGRNAREVARRLDEFRDKGSSLSEGVELENGGRLQVALATRALPETLRASQTQDNNILGVALEVRDKDKDIPTVLVTKDVNL